MIVARVKTGYRQTEIGKAETKAAGFRTKSMPNTQGTDTEDKRQLCCENVPSSC